MTLERFDQLTEDERRFLAMHASYQASNQDDARHADADPDRAAAIRARWTEIQHAIFPGNVFEAPDPERFLVTNARRLAIAWHGDQKDKAGKMYIRHPQRIANSFSKYIGQGDTDAAAVGWLHDVLEDTECTIDGLRAANIPERIIAAVVILTHGPNEPLDSYYARVKANPLALKVKLADIADNMDPDRLVLLDLDVRRRLVDKYEHATEVLTS